MRTVLQIEVRQNGKLRYVFRYDFNMETLYHQNRSKDVHISKSEFLYEFVKWKSEVEAREQTVIGRDVSIKELWPQK